MPLVPLSESRPKFNVSRQQQRWAVTDWDLSDFFRKYYSVVYCVYLRDLNKLGCTSPSVFWRQKNSLCVPVLYICLFSAEAEREDDMQRAIRDLFSELCGDLIINIVSGSGTIRRLDVALLLPIASSM